MIRSSWLVVAARAACYSTLTGTLPGRNRVSKAASLLLVAGLGFLSFFVGLSKVCSEARRSIRCMRSGSVLKRGMRDRHTGVWMLLEPLIVVRLTLQNTSTPLQPKAAIYSGCAGWLLVAVELTLRSSGDCSMLSSIECCYRTCSMATTWFHCKTPPH